MSTDETQSLNDILNSLRGVGIEELSDPIPLKTQSGATVVLKITNISTEEEILSLLSAEDFKGHHWLQRVKCEILSRSISSINGVDLREIQDVPDPNDPSQSVSVRPALRGLFLTWGPETLQTLWKIFMVHCQNIEDRLLRSFPDSATMTEYEKRFMDRSMQLVDEFTKELAAEMVQGSEEES